MHAGVWLLVTVAVFLAFTAFAFYRSFYVACIKGFDPPPQTRCESVDSQDIPSLVWNGLERMDQAIEPLGARHLGYMKLTVRSTDQFSSVWWANDGEVVIYGQAAHIAPNDQKEAGHAIVHITCESTLSDGIRIMTSNDEFGWNLVGSDSNQSRSFPSWMPVASLLEIHAARLVADQLFAPSIEPSLDRIIELNEEFQSQLPSEYQRPKAGCAEPDGRLRVSTSYWLRMEGLQILSALKLLGIVNRTSARRELKELGLLHLWKKP